MEKCPEKEQVHAVSLAMKGCLTEKVLVDLVITKSSDWQGMKLCHTFQVSILQWIPEGPIQSHNTGHAQTMKNTHQSEKQESNVPQHFEFVHFGHA
jgi:hypothetical protein